MRMQGVLRVLAILGAVAAIIFTIGSMLTMWVFAAAGLANTSDPAETARVGRWVLGFSLFCAAGIGVGGWLLWRRRPGWSAAASLTPAAAMFGTLVYLLVK